jgi:proteic killer suppression protein
VIKSFGDSEREKIYQHQVSRRLPRDIQQEALQKLRMINNAVTLTDLRIPPANRLEKLTGDRTDHYNIQVNDQWRICFIWRDQDAYEVAITDYH